jgi:hypothetical protein
MLRHWLKRHLIPCPQTTTVKSPAARRPARRPELEVLEDRVTPAVTYHGGPLLAHVGVEALFYGSTWQTDATHNQMAGQITTYLQSIVTSTYMDQLREYSEPGNDIGHGQFLDAKIDAANLAGGATVTQTMVQQLLKNEIANGVLRAPDPNRLYFVYLPANVHIDISGDAGYHSFIYGTTIHYAVIINPTGNYNPPSGVSPLQAYTIVSSHELAEAVTDPEYNNQVQFTGWRQDGGQNSGRVEIGDLVAWDTGTINGFAVQKEWSNKQYAATGNGSFLMHTVNAKSFAMTGGGTVYELDADGGIWHRTAAGAWDELATGVASDALGAAGEVFYLTTQGSLYVAAEGQAKVLIAGNVQSFALLTDADGVSYHTADGKDLQYVNGSSSSEDQNTLVVAQVGTQGVWEFDLAHGTRVQLTAANAAALAGDGHGDVVGEFRGSGVWLYTPGTGWKQLSGADASLLAMDARGDVFGEFRGWGVWEYQGNGGWAQLTGADATLLAVDAQGDVFGEFAGWGVWAYQGSGGWTQLTGADAFLLAVDARGDVFGEFRGWGVWAYQGGSGWAKLTGADATLLGVNARGDLVGEFRGSGVWAYQGSGGWKQLTGADATRLALDANGVAVGEFAGYGLWGFNPGKGWTQLSATDASLIALT